MKRRSQNRAHHGCARLLLALLVVSIFSVALVSAQRDVTFEPNRVDVKVKVGDFEQNTITITNNNTAQINIDFQLEPDAAKFVSLDPAALTIDGGTSEILTITVFGHNITRYEGPLTVSGTILRDLPLNLTVTGADGLPIEAMVIDIDPISESAEVGDVFNFKVGIQNLLSGQKYNATVKYSIDRLEDDSTYIFERAFFEEEETITIDTTTTIVKEFDMPEFIRPGTYVINVEANYLGIASSASRTFKVVEPFWDVLILGILPVRWAIFTGIFLITGLGGFLYYRHKKKSQKRYSVKVDYDLLPGPGPRSVQLGFIAETTKKAYFELEQLKTHTLIAGSTGGGKTVSAEVLIEEALIKGVAVVVFDPTAQWTGFLRKNTDKKMFSLYPKYGMKKTDARAFNGNVRQILNAREKIEIKKYMRPGEINVFSVSKLDPEEIDTLVANTIREIFHANLDEARELRLMIIFDEVHRLLPKFGGSGNGFIQIERGAREFRKWGVGLMLISQVLTDFIGETKANINTELQMRTRDQNDLDRIKEKYGGYMLQSLIKSSTGTGMIENSSYNKGNPYFIAFRPLLHEHARLSDKELDNYNKYNDKIDDLEFSIESLEAEGVDIFDLKLELKMAQDKVKSGSFNMVDIYLEGLEPRVADQWTKLGKQPPKRQANLVSESELREEFQKAQEARRKFEAEGKKEGGEAGGEAKKVESLILSNGVMITSRQELTDAVENMQPDVFAQYVTAEKNDFATWLEQVDADLAAKAKATKTKEELMKVLSGEA